jgi:predicted transcriptional regulator
MSKERSLEQVSVRLEPELREAVQTVAKAEHRTESQQIAYFVARMIEARQPQPAQSQQHVV